MYKIITIQILLLTLASCNNVVNYNKIETILEEIALNYILQEENRINKLDSIFNISNQNIPIRLEIFQDEDYKDCCRFYILLSNSNINDIVKLPSKIFKINNRFVFVYLNSNQSISKENMPNELLGIQKDYLLDETSWEILICKKCYKYIVVKNKYIIPIEFIKQFNEFSCNCKRNHSKFKQNVRIEDAIIDTIDGILPPPPSSH
jgi:hypothetical protein